MGAKVRVNFLIPESLYQMLSEIAEAEGSSASAEFRKAVKQYVYEYKNQGINKFYKHGSANEVQSIAGEQANGSK